MNMLGGKTKTGAVLLALGVAIYNTVDICPVPAWIPWIKYVGSIACAVGGALGLVGIGHKVDKATDAVVAADQAAPSALTEERFLQILARARAKQAPPKGDA